MSKIHWCFAACLTAWLGAHAAHADEGTPVARGGDAVLSQRDYVRAVLAKNPGIDSARASLNAALARVRQAGAFADPMIEVTAAPLSFVPPVTRAGYEVGIRQELPWFGKRALERDVASAEAAAARHDVETMRQTLALSAVSLYSQYYVVERSLEINAHHVELLTAMRGAALATLETGRGSAAEPLQVDGELTMLEQQRVALNAERDVIRAQMNELLHRAPDAPIGSPPSELPAEARAAEQGAGRGAEQGAARGAGLGAERGAARGVERVAEAPKRPELEALRERIRAESARASAAERERYPNFTVSTAYSSMWEMPAHRWSVGIGISLPVQVERRAGAVDEARAMQSYYESELRRASDSSKTERYVALRRVEESRQTLGLFEQKALPLARQRVEVQRAAFIASSSSLAMLLEAERALRSIELDYESARATHARRLAELDRAEGRLPGLGAEASR